MSCQEDDCCQDKKKPDDDTKKSKVEDEKVADHGESHAAGGGCCGGGGPKLAPKRERKETSLPGDEDIGKSQDNINAELEAVLNFLYETDDLKVKESHLEGTGRVNFFRGINFHVAVLKHSQEIMMMIPTLMMEERITSLKTVEDSEALGQYMLVCDNIDKLKLCMQEGDCCSGPGTEKQSEKKPSLLELAEDQDFATEKAYYMRRKKDSEAIWEKIGLVFMFIGLVFMFALFFTFSVWPQKYQIMTYEIGFNSAWPLTFIGVTKGLTIKGKPRVLALATILAFIGGTGYMCHFQSTKEGLLDKLKDSFSLTHDLGYVWVIGTMPQQYIDYLNENKGGKKKKKKKKNQPNMPKPPPPPTSEEMERIKKMEQAQKAQQIYNDANKKKKKKKGGNQNQNQKKPQEEDL